MVRSYYLLILIESLLKLVYEALLPVVFWLCGTYFNFLPFLTLPSYTYLVLVGR